MLDYKYVLYHIAQWIAQKGQFGGLDMHKMLFACLSCEQSHGLQ